MISKIHINEIENLLNKENIIKYKILQISFDIACIKLLLSNNEIYIAKFYVNKKNNFNAIESESKNILYLNERFEFFPKHIKSNNDYLIIQYLKNDNKKPDETNKDFLEAIVKIHSISNNLYGFNFNTQIGAIEQINNYENSWTNFYANKRLNPIFDLVNSQNVIASDTKNKIYYIIKNIKDLIPDKPSASLLHGDLWEGNILFKNNKFVGFIDPGTFFGHNEMEIAYLRWFMPKFIDSNFLDKYNEYINLDKSYLEYEPIYQLYYALCNVALWDKSYIKEVKRLINKIKI
jgi:fructosamine-3-kinase